MFLEVMTAFAGYYFARQTAFQAGIEEVRRGWSQAELHLTSPNRTNEHYEFYRATFGRVVLRILRYGEQLEHEYLINLTVIPNEPADVEQTLYLLGEDLRGRNMQLSSANAVPDPQQKSCVVRLHNGPRSLSLVLCRGKLQMITVSENQPGG